MKRILLLSAFAFNASLLFSQTLFTYGGTAVTKEEFLRAYNKNKSASDDKEKALREYLDLYSKFKLKVKAAQDMQLDTLQQLTSDLQNFRTQIDETYLNNDDALNGLIEEAFLRSQKDLHVIHFFAALPEKSAVEDSLKVVKAMQEVYTGLQGGKKEYEKLAADVSSKYVTVNVKAGDIGYITAFSVPYEYENIIYALKNGEASKAYRSKNGLHIFKIVDERKGVGRWRIAQIMVATPPGGDAAANTRIAQQKADSVYLRIKAGEDFGELAKQYSDDKLTYMSGGLMPEFTVGKYEMPFEQEVFKLAKDGEVSRPFPTQYGFHIVKRISVQPVQTNKSDAAYMYEIKQKVLQDSRVNSAKELFTKSVVKLVGYKKNIAVKDADLFRYADSVVANPALNGAREFPISSKVIYSSAKGNIKGSDWLSFIREYKTNPEIYKGESNTALLDKFITLKSVEYYKNNLEEYNPEFRYQMEEFKEGNLLFEVMERKVWSSAANDTTGLQNYYNAHKNKYQWGASADIIIFSCNNKKVADATLDALKQGRYWKKIAEESNNTLQADSGRYELVQIALADGVKATAGMVTPVNVNPSDGTAGFIKILKLHPANEQRSFEEARGLVINDYQSILEEKWMEELKSKYPVKVDEAVFQSLLK
ncbi:foldase protein PrsA [Ferruginibacter sp. SUN106]|uniref:foldase protein PrsA n=1 Tax=Ferruginibacter sp. SUN106 TaxID=2978348 RepID=UPI003D35C959